MGSKVSIFLLASNGDRKRDHNTRIGEVGTVKRGHNNSISTNSRNSIAPMRYSQQTIPTALQRWKTRNSITQEAKNISIIVTPPPEPPAASANLDQTRTINHDKETKRRRKKEGRRRD